MRRKIFIGLFAIILGTNVSAQVKDISFAIAPTAEYVWWNKKSAIENGFMAGGYVGFGFGRNLELLGSYSQSLGLKSTIDGFSAPDNIKNAFVSTDVDARRWGGELKGNIPMAYSFQPYITLGSGIQTIKANEVGQDAVYFTFGLGAKFNLARRLTLNVQAKGSRFNLDASNILHKTSEPRTSTYNQWITNNVSDKNMFNWSVGAGLQLYLGGRNPNELTELDHSYTNLKSFKFVLAPSLGYINFDNDNNFRNAYLAGASLGFDFTEYIGIRGFYYQAMNDEKISSSFDKLSLYGADFSARLNVSNGVVPYITVGGGYLKAGNGYQGKVATVENESGIFAKGGVGLAIPLGKHLELFGAANMLYTTNNENATNALKSPDKLQTNILYNAGIRIKFAKENEKYTYQDLVSQLHTPETNNVTEQTKVQTTTKVAPVSQKQKDIDYYNTQIATVEKQIQNAYRQNDINNASLLLKEKKKWEELRNNYVAENIPYPTENQAHLVRMTPEQLQTLISEVVNKIEEGEGKTPDQRIDRLEKLLLELKNNDKTIEEQQKINQSILEAVKNLEEKVEKTNIIVPTTQRTNTTINRKK
ncbi:outer membrane beta-barrel protein [uncultured Capnocytophaga sp.]|uniref:outer membrane beta-barrel protein n=1 Tax=uncultured Capnocytophaga sp. TaxID=159273 RepID=UPI0028E961F4|nr:outer membrane beta-barrel protein [uncultured Capnocytophaga sp.]